MISVDVVLGTVGAVCPMQESPVANKIKEAFFSERGLAGNVHKLPFDKLFAIDSVKKVWLLSAACFPCSTVHTAFWCLTNHMPLLCSLVIHATIPSPYQYYSSAGMAVV